jgi:hypothetical protein
MPCPARHFQEKAPGPNFPDPRADPISGLLVPKNCFKMAVKNGTATQIFI